jgi:hypothetical protein
MKFFFWILIAIVVAFAIYWLVDWQSHHEDGE